MRIPRNPLMLALFTLAAAMLACSAIPTTPTVTNTRMTTDANGTTVTSTYAPGDAFFVFADVSGLAAGSPMEAQWFAVNAQGLAPGSLISTSKYEYVPGVAKVYFQLTTSDGGDWPTGSYRVELFLNGAKIGEQGFTVQ
jgi:hypothetical protein